VVPVPVPVVVTNPSVLEEGGGPEGGRGGGAGLFCAKDVVGGGGRGLDDPLEGVGGAGLFPFPFPLILALVVLVELMGGLLPVGGGGCDIVVAAAIGIGSRWFEMLIDIVLTG
jgi:hypothetical protein